MPLNALKKQGGRGRESSQPDNHGAQARVAEYQFIAANFDILKAQQAHSSSDERGDFTCPQLLGIVTCERTCEEIACEHRRLTQQQFV